jgi:hypothetical protein
MNLKQFSELLNDVEDTTTMVYGNVSSDAEKEDYTIRINYDGERLFFSWMTFNNVRITRGFHIAGDNKKVISTITLVQLEGAFDQMNPDWVEASGEIELSVSSNVDLWQVSASDFIFAFSFWNEKCESQIPPPWLFEAYYTAEIPASALKYLDRAANVALEYKPLEIFPLMAMKGVSVSGWADIIEIVGISLIQTAYKFIRGEVSENFSIVLTAEFVNELNFSPEFREVKISVSPTHVLVESESNGEVKSFLGELLGGTYFYPRIPLNNVAQGRVRVKRQELLNALEKVKESNAREILVDLKVLKNKLFINNFTLQNLEKEPCLDSFMSSFNRIKLQTILSGVEEDEVYLLLPKDLMQTLVVESSDSQDTLYGMLRCYTSGTSDCTQLGIKPDVQHLKDIPGDSNSPSSSLKLVEQPYEKEKFTEWFYPCDYSNESQHSLESEYFYKKDKLKELGNDLHLKLNLYKRSGKGTILCFCGENHRRDFLHRQDGILWRRNRRY